MSDWELDALKALAAEAYNAEREAERLMDQAIIEYRLRIRATAYAEAMVRDGRI